MSRPTLGDVARGRSTARGLCGRCVDNVAAYTLDITTSGGHSTGPVRVCWPCLIGLSDQLLHDIGHAHQPGGAPVILAPVTGYSVQIIR